MTQFGWDVCADPVAMLTFLWQSGRFSERKARLLAAAACRRVWPLLTDERSKGAVEVAERYVDGLAGEDELAASAEAAVVFADTSARESGVTSPYDLDFGALCLLHRGPIVDSFSGFAAWHVASHAPDWVAAAHGPSMAASWTYGACLEYASWAAAAARTSEGFPGMAGLPDEAAARQALFESEIRSEVAAQVAVLRCIFGSSFWPSPALEPSLLRWNDGLVVKLARAAYDERSLPEGTLDRTRLAVLADALEEAGCGEPELLGHCRQQGLAHVRGCWAIDLLLGQEVQRAETSPPRGTARWAWISWR